MKTRLLLLLVSLGLWVTGCSRITEENYAKVESGMTMEQVVGILGKPTESSQSEFAGLSSGGCTWKGSEGTISIQFVNGKMLSKQFSKEK